MSHSTLIPDVANNSIQADVLYLWKTAVVEKIMNLSASTAGLYRYS